MFLCKYCGHDKGKVTAAPAPHYARLECAQCGRWVKWLARDAVYTMEPETQTATPKEVQLDLFQPVRPARASQHVDPPANA